METRSETKSLPRNRKCGNCRYFEPAPLWRKGWCRNPRLYDRRANHLVDATTIDCEQVFRARIYWEPIPPSEQEMQETVNDIPLSRPASFSADSGGRSPHSPTTNSVLRPSSNKPVIVRREVAPDARFIKKQGRYRKWLLDNIPYYDKIDGPIHTMNYRVLLPWLLVVILLIFILLNVTNKSKDNKSGLNPTEPALTSAVTSEPALSVAVNSNQSTTLTVTKTIAPTPANSKTPLPTPTLSGAITTAVPPSPTPQNAKVVQAKVQAPKGLRLRQTPCTTDSKPECKVLTTIPDGSIVQITGGSVLQEGIEWWPITYNGMNGFVSKDYLLQINS